MPQVRRFSELVMLYTVLLLGTAGLIYALGPFARSLAG